MAILSSVSPSVHASARVVDLSTAPRPITAEQAERMASRVRPTPEPTPHSPATDDEVFAILEAEGMADRQAIEHGTISRADYDRMEAGRQRTRDAIHEIAQRDGRSTWADAFQPVVADEADIAGWEDESPATPSEDDQRIVAEWNGGNHDAQSDPFAIEVWCMTEAECYQAEHELWESESASREAGEAKWACKARRRQVHPAEVERIFGHQAGIMQGGAW